ncbi:MAG: hypothetical protein LBQ52_04860 [Helicobacteraceae bacterium]|jgi:hypothetical protein|nr:hypothetical protein [Helicobacteraceae bacterium]
MNDNFNRGVLSAEIQALAKEHLGREITRAELRLYPYLDHVLKNGLELDRRKINAEERKILLQLKQEERFGSFGCDKNFYDYIQQVLWLAYVEAKK